MCTLEAKQIIDELVKKYGLETGSMDANAARPFINSIIAKMTEETSEKPPIEKQLRKQITAGLFSLVTEGTGNGKQYHSGKHRPHLEGTTKVRRGAPRRMNSRGSRH